MKRGLYIWLWVALIVIFLPSGLQAQNSPQVYMRWRLQEPSDLQYWVHILAVVDPYDGVYDDLGFYGNSGHLEREPLTDNSKWLKTGDWSEWVEMPVSYFWQWYVSIDFRDINWVITNSSALVELEFATEPSGDKVVHRSLASTGTGKLYPWYPYRSIEIRMPIAGESVADVRTFEEWSTDRYHNFQRAVNPSALKPQRFPITTYWQEGLDKTPTMVNNDLNVLGGMGINGFQDEELPTYIIPFTKEQYRDLLQSHGFKYFIPSDWAVNLQYKGLDIRWHPGETLRDWLKRLHETYYQGVAAANVGDWIFDNIYRVYMADETESVFVAQGGCILYDNGSPPNCLEYWFGINNVPQIHDEFVKYLQRQGLTPEFFGVDTWDGVQALDWSNWSNGSYVNLDLIGKRRYYWTKRFSSYASSSFFWREASEAIQRYFPSKPFTTFDLQADPLQRGAMWDGSFDVFEAGYEKASTFLFTEDWNSANDLGFVYRAYGMDLLRGASRSHGQSYGGYLVGFRPWQLPPPSSSRAAAYSYLAQGVSSLDYYLYGPVWNIGPAWGEIAEAMKVYSQVNFDIAKFEDILVGSTVSESRVALLIANTSEINQQSGGIHFGKERQAIYGALRHAGISVDLVGEDQIVRDNILQKYKVLYIVDPHIRHDVQEAIKFWVSRGGFLWAESGAGMWDEYDQICDVLNPVFGISQQTVMQQKNFPPWGPYYWITRVFDYNLVELDKVKVKLDELSITATVWGQKGMLSPLKEKTTKILGKFNSDGSSAVIVNKYRGGRAMLVGFLAGETYQRAHWPEHTPDGWAFLIPGQDLYLGLNERKIITGILEDKEIVEGLGWHAKIHRDLVISQPGLLSSVRKNESGWVVFLVNGPQRPLNNVTVTVKKARAKGFTSAESAVSGPIGFYYRGDDLVFSIPLDEADMIALRGGARAKEEGREVDEADEKE